MRVGKRERERPPLSAAEKITGLLQNKDERENAELTGAAALPRPAAQQDTHKIVRRIRSLYEYAEHFCHSCSLLLPGGNKAIPCDAAWVFAFCSSPAQSMQNRELLLEVPGFDCKLPTKCRQLTALRCRTRASARWKSPGGSRRTCADPPRKSAASCAPRPCAHRR